MKIDKVIPLDDFLVSVNFDNGDIMLYDLNPLFDKWQVFNDLTKNKLFELVQVDAGGQGIVWNDEIDLSKYEIRENGSAISE